MSDWLFVIYKAVSQFIMPLGLTFLVMVGSAIFYFRGFRKVAAVFFLCSITWLWIWSTPLWSDFIRGRLESKFSYRSANEFPEAEAIVVLGGGVRGFTGSQFPPFNLNAASDREWFAAQLYHANKAKSIILSGGADPISGTGASAIGMKMFLIDLGIPPEVIRLGTDSRNTVENVREVLQMIKSPNVKPILLVTSALHMQRAYWLFSRSGLNVIPAPSDFEVVHIPFSLYRLLPDGEALASSTRAARELVGLFFYRLGLH